MNKSLIKFFVSFAFSVGFAFLIPTAVSAAPIEDFAVTLHQPNGQTLACYVSGDEYFNYYHDIGGNVIIKNASTGYYTFAENKGGKAAASSYIAKTNNFFSTVFISKPLNVMKTSDLTEPIDSINKEISAKAVYSALQAAPTSGTLNSLGVFIRFSDEDEFTTGIDKYKNMFNDVSTGAISLKQYYKEVSNNKMNINTTLYPKTTDSSVLSYQDLKPRAYYSPFAADNIIGYTSDTDRTNREYSLLKRAIQSVATSIPSTLNIDADNNGYVDNICFIVSGGPDGWSALLWPHMWYFEGLQYSNISINGKIVGEFQFQLDKMMNAGVLAHETFHVLGAPDLYHYYSGGTPVGPWDVMEDTARVPQHMLTYMKLTYGKWITSIPKISTAGTYTLHPSTAATNNAYIIKSPASATEYFVVEYRKKTGIFESSLPNSGLIVYRIDPTVKDGNMSGPPDEVYVYRPDDLDTNISQANLSSDFGRTAIGGSASPLYLSDGTPGELNISDVSACGDTISFNISFPDCPPTDFIVSNGVLKDYYGPDAIVSIRNDLGIKEIDRAFYQKSNITGVVIPSGITTINQYAFRKCDNLKAVIIPNSVVNIDTDAFYESNNVTLYGGDGSYAQQFASENGIRFIVKPNPSSTTGLKAVSGSYNSIKLTWNAATGASGYTIYRGATKDGAYYYLVSTSATSYINTSLTTGTNYYYKIYAYNYAGPIKIAGAFTTAVTAKPIPAMPASFTAVRASVSSIKLSWSAVAGASAYVVYRYNSSTKKYEYYKAVSSTSYINSGLTKNAKYYYKVAAYRLVGTTRFYGNMTTYKIASPY